MYVKLLWETAYTLWEMAFLDCRGNTCFLIPIQYSTKPMDRLWLLHLYAACCLTHRKAFLTFIAIITFCATLEGKGASFHNPVVGSRQIPSLSIQPCWADCLWFTCQHWRKTHCRVLTTAQFLPIAGLISIFLRTPKLLDCHPETYRSLRSIRPESVIQLHTLYPGRYNEVFGNRREIKIETQWLLTQSGNSQQCCGKEEVLIWNVNAILTLLFNLEYWQVPTERKFETVTILTSTPW